MGWAWLAQCTHKASGQQARCSDGGTNQPPSEDGPCGGAAEVHHSLLGGRVRLRRRLQRGSMSSCLHSGHLPVSRHRRATATANASSDHYILGLRNSACRSYNSREASRCTDGAAPRVRARLGGEEEAAAEGGYWSSSRPVS